MYDKKIEVDGFADINDLVLGAGRVARVIADGDADRPGEYATTILQRIAWQSQRELLTPLQTSQLRKKHIREMDSMFSETSSVLAEMEIEEVLKGVDERDRKIIVMRSCGFGYEDIVRELGMLGFPAMPVSFSQATSTSCRRHAIIFRRCQTIGSTNSGEPHSPNPERKGCPEPSIFGALSRREIKFDDPVWDDIEHCSPCYCQFAEIREEMFKQDRQKGLRRATRAGLILLQLGAVCFIGSEAGLVRVTNRF